MKKKINYKIYPVDNSRYIYVPTKQNKQVVHRILKTPKYKKQDAIYKTKDMSVAINKISALDLDKIVTKNQLKEKLSIILSSLSPKEERVLRMRFGINVEEHTLDEIGLQLSVTKHRIAQIEAKALRKLKHPSKSDILKDYLNVA